MSTLNDHRDPDGKVLEWVNKQRVKFDLPTLAALPENAPPYDTDICTKCPIAAGLSGVGHAYGGMVGTNIWTEYERRVSYPDFVREFVRQHDKDRFGTA